MKQPQSNSIRSRTLAAFGAAIVSAGVFGLGAAAPAQNAYTWTGGGGDGNWNTGANWGGSAPSSLQSYLNFSGSSRLTNTNNFSAGSGGFQIYFKNTAGGAFNLYGNGINFYDFGGNDPNIQNEGTTYTPAINFSVTIANTHVSGVVRILNVNLNSSPAQGPITFNGPISAPGDGNARVINIYGPSTITFNGVISDGSTTGSTVAVTKGAGSSDSGTTILSAANSYSGQTTVNGGKLQIGNNGASGTLGSGSVAVANAATISFKRTDSITVNNTLSGSANFTISQDGSGSTTLGGGSDNSFAQAAVNAGTLALNKSSGADGGSVHALGGTTETVNNGGTLQLGGGSVNVDQIQNGASVMVNGGGMFDLGGQAGETIASITLNGTGIGGAGALINSSSTASTLTLTSASSLGSATTIGGTGNITLAGTGAITGSQTLTKVGNNTLTLLC